MQAKNEDLLVAFWRMGRALKRSHGPLEPALLWVLHATACEGPSRLSDLAGRLQLDLSTVSRHVRTLEDAGYLERTPDKDDRRATQISISAKGTRILDEGRAAQVELLDSALTKWTESDRKNLERLLGRLANELEHNTVGTNA
ncbi:MarR family winged helix-turn-helix transcriptional regulator [Tenggerimyces flavus]|uniref:MarR family winged helix-turn-helix transcriptional regulator n=1 Tax=Tenggerimyces flavus TaxID=1708749 RepID=A0ABV7Y6Q9_9ACTN|nr:MarR family winged helix-turn-helix transcriptional regulator [Tenggerimyces flavus]MBM7791113.1 DNA-binding MarR family transcriptional regulator [Tenggerimyces flavus]